jgi:hypothetical protein
MGLEGQVLTGFFPDWAPGGGVFVDLADAVPRPLAPSLRVAVLAGTTRATFPSGVGVSAVWVMARAEVCPARIREGSVAATACIDLDAGSLVSQGTLANARVEGHPWWVPGALARVTWAPEPGFWIEGAAGLGLPLERYTFYYRPGGAGAVDVYQMPVIGAELGIGAGYRFP